MEGRIQLNFPSCYIKLNTMFKNPFSFEGRIRRTEYGLSIIFYGIIAAILNVLMLSGGSETVGFAFAYIPMIWFVLAQGAKRCHDVGNSGWWQLIPFYGLWMLFQDGESKSNDYGQNPKEIQLIDNKTSSSN